LKKYIAILFFFLIAAGLGFYFYSKNSKLIPQTPSGMVFLMKTKNNFLFIDKTPVTVADFKKFIKETKYKTDAEKFGDAGVFDFKTGTWSLVKGANWEFPEGKNQPKAQSDHPVTQVSWQDTQIYCKWAGKRLPCKEEFDFAANNAEEEQKTYAWGENIIENGKYKVNFWQGSFPFFNTNEDGFLRTSPVGYFGANKLGLVDIGGNVWQWLAEWHPEKPTEKMQGGGSFLCDPKICHGFKIGNTASTTPETSLMHVGFRCVKEIER
jgi:formylglycine-generating enzyme